MAYSDYGGYAYRDGVRVEARSDAVLSPEGIKSTPGAWPGWTLLEGRSGGSFHALLGDGPIFVGLYKQSHLEVHRLGEELDIVTLLTDPEPDAIGSYPDDGKTVRYIDSDHFINIGKPCVLEVDGHRITITWEYSANYYIYVKLEQPDGTVWTGFSGYGVGAGFEDAGYGFSTQAQEDRLRELYPT